MKPLLFAVLIVSALAAPAQEKRTFTGVITDEMCPEADHSRMRMGSTDAECAIACNSAHGAPYVLYDGKDAYNLTDQQTPQKFAGRKVTVTGALETKNKTIHVESMSAAR